MNTLKSIGFLAILALLYNCKPANRQESIISEAKTADISTGSLLSSSAAVEENKDQDRKFIRTADLKFRVKNVITSTSHIENIAKRHGGFITYTKLVSDIDYVTSNAVSADSSLETTFFTVSNQITLRVPNTKLDTTLKEISKSVVYLDYRVIKADDVALQVLSNELVRERAENSENRLNSAMDSRGRKLRETTDAEALLQQKEEQSDIARISNLALTDQIQFSTVKLEIYQRQQILREVISNNKDFKAYKPWLGVRILESLKFGWQILESIILFVFKLWALILLGILSYLIYKRYLKQKPGEVNKKYWENKD